MLIARDHPARLEFPTADQQATLVDRWRARHTLIRAEIAELIAQMRAAGSPDQGRMHVRVGITNGGIGELAIAVECADTRVQANAHAIVGKLDRQILLWILNGIAWHPPSDVLTFTLTPQGVTIGSQSIA